MVIDRTRRTSGVRHLTAIVVLAVFVAASCSSSDDESVASGADDGGCFAEPDLEAVTTGAATGEGTVTLLAHDSFAVSESTFAAFTAETGIEVEVLLGGDGGTLVNQAVLAGDNPAADVLFGIDNTLLCAGLENSVFVPYEATDLDNVPADLQIDPHHRVTPIDYGDVCANYWIDAFSNQAEPQSLDDLRSADFADQFVTQNPESSTPGLAFLLATIARYGVDGWEDYWTALFENGAAVSDDWETAYYGEFAAGGGDRSVVTSYASSPAAEVFYADPPVASPPTGVISDTCYRQIEFAGVLRGTDQPAEAALLIDFMLSPTFQEDIPLNMFVFPANSTAKVPEVFAEHAEVIADAVSLDPELVAANRNDWTERWTELRRG
ncbi:MAG: thiamine ABC transporter substrate-binding protein [Acidimicrobiales bacterium]